MKKAIIIIVIFLFLVSLGVLALYHTISKQARPETVRLKTGSYLVLNLAGNYPERSDFDFSFFMDISRTPVPFYKLIQAIDFATDDNRVDGLVIIGSSNSLSRVQSEELYDALEKFGESKKIYGYVENLGLGTALLMSHCDSLFMPEVGNIVMPGLAIQPWFYKGLLDKIGIGFDVVQSGKYKGGFETFIRNEFSEPFEVSLNDFLDDLYSFYEDRITEARGLSKYQFDSLISKAIIFGDDILSSGLVDGFMYRNQLDSLIDSRIKGGRTNIDVDDYKIGMRKYVNSIESRINYADEKIALIVAEGNIMSGTARRSPYGRSQGIYATTLSQAIDKAADDDDIKAIVLRLDSGGGSALASDIIWNSIVRARSKKPFVVSMSTAAASGGYYIAMAADTIVAGKGTMTGSIGVVSAKPHIGELMEKSGITQQSFTRGKYAQIYSTLDRPWTEDEKSIIRASIDNVYREFTTKAAVGRNMSLEDLDAAAQGRIWTGRDAKEQGLVDINGGIWDAIRCAQKMANIPITRTPKIELFPKQVTFFELIGMLDRDLIRTLFSGFVFDMFDLNIEGFTKFNYGEALLICPVEVVGEKPFGYRF